MLALIPLFPFLGFLVNAFFGRRLPKAVSGGVACAAMIASFGVSIAATWAMLGQPGPVRAIEQVLYEWIAVGELHVPLAFRVDPLASVMILVVTGIGSLIHIYSTAYMHEETDSEYARYFSYLNLFAAFMLVLVLGTTFPVLFVGWEGVGLCSYLLIGFWYRKRSAVDAGKKAFVVNRVGDFAFLLGMLLLWTAFGTLDFQEIAAQVAPMPPEAGLGVISVATLLLFIGATGKSAQIPLYTWLPDAMEGPTPVSALIHAATMVTAGVYMIGRNAELFSHAPDTLLIVAIVGAATALMAGTIGLVQNDIKRVLAYSTVSQLGYMFLAMGVGAYAAGIFHLYTHAFFKALLFLGSGAVIHALAGEQDIRHMGGLKRELPLTYWTFVIGAVAIAGVPPLAGFFSKDEILYRTFASGHTILWTIGIVTSLLTATYMFRLVFLTFHGERRAAPAAADAAHGHGHGHGHGRAAGHGHLHDAPPAMAMALVVLAVGSVLAGFVGVPAALGGSNRIEHFLEPSFTAHGAATYDAAMDSAEAAAHPPAADHADDHLAVERTLMLGSTVIALVGIGLAWYFFLRRPQAADAVAARAAPIHRLLLNKYWVDELYDAAIVHPIRRLSERVLWRQVDAGVIDGAVNGAGSIIGAGSVVLRRLQTGTLRAYAASLLLGAVVIGGYYLWRYVQVGG
ncbi:MAG TPA: NADH-quinone oxidoreductase subunit L [Vicinamibacterales bacterium]|nr:NADH-quinone oxidoreductase subunit L [Vicinamibacterales bacterium]